MKEYAPRIRLSQAEHDAVLKMREVNNVLIVGDLHTPFDLDSYFDFCVEQYHRYNCNKVVFIGDVIDSHHSSFHGTSPNGFGGGYELKKAIERLGRWHDYFPDAHVTTGNHDRIIYRKAFASGIPEEWMRAYEDVLGVPNWNFVPSIEIDGVLYVHGEGGTAKTAMKNHLKPIVQGHLHTQLYIEYLNNIFAMQVGCGIDFDRYAFDYAKYGKPPQISCGLVLDNGTTPLIKKMI